MYCFTLEIVTKAEIAEHFKKGMMIGRPSDIVDVTSSQTFLTGCCTSKFQFASTEKMVLELIHAGRREQHRGIPARNQYIAWLSDTAFGFEEGKVFFTKFIRFHGIIFWFRQADMPVKFLENLYYTNFHA